MCDGGPCPVTLEPGATIVRMFNFSTFWYGYSIVGQASDRVLVYIVDMINYRRYVANQSFVFGEFSQPFPERSGGCSAYNPYRTKGRGVAVITVCVNPGADNCTIWYSHTVGDIADPCAPNCTTSTVGDGQCHMPCNNTACDFDAGDCQPPPPPGPPPPPPPPPPCSAGCLASMINDGVCQSQCNVVPCLYDGNDCVPKDPCVPNPCGTGRGTCQKLGSSYLCQCTAAYCGPNCQYSAVYNANSQTSSGYCAVAFGSCMQAHPNYNVNFCCYDTAIQGFTCNAASAKSTPQPPPSPPVALSSAGSRFKLL